MDLMGGLGGGQTAAGGFWDDINEEPTAGGWNDVNDTKIDIDINNKSGGDGSANSTTELNNTNNNNDEQKIKNNPFTTFEDNNDPSTYMDLYESIKNDIKIIEKNTRQLNKLTEQYNAATTKQENADIMINLDKIMDDNSQISIKVKTELKKANEDNEVFKANNIGSSVAQWRINQLNSCTRRYKNATSLFQETLSEFQQTLRVKQKRQIGIVAGEALTEEQKDEMVDDYEAAQEYIQKQFQMINSSDAMLDRLVELEDRHKGMLKIEQSIRELQELWTELNILISEQQEYIDHIENNVQMTKDYVQSATKQLKSAEGHQKTSRKLTLYLILYGVCILIAIIGSIFGGVFGGGGG